MLVIAIAACADDGAGTATKSAGSTTVTPVGSAAVTAQPTSSSRSATTGVPPSLSASASASRPAPQALVDWIGAVGATERSRLPYAGSSHTLLTPAGTRVAKAGEGHAGFAEIEASSAKSSVKLRRTATLHDPTAVFDAYPPCPTMEQARARAKAATTIIDVTWQHDNAGDLGEGPAQMWVFRDASGVGFYGLIDFADPVDKVSQESTTIGCCAAGGPADMATVSARMDEDAARRHVAICASLALRAH